MDWLQAILSLIGVLGLILVLFYYLKKYGRNSYSGGGKRLRVIDKITVSRDSMLAVVSVCDKLMLVAMSAHCVAKLCDIDMTEDEYLSGNSGSVAFSEVLANFLSSGKKKKAEQETEINNSCVSEGEIPLETNDFTSDETE